jgi:hypothetical protein
MKAIDDETGWALSNKLYNLTATYMYQLLLSVSIYVNSKSTLVGIR